MAKSILEIDVQSDKFQAFIAQFQKYQSAVKAMPAAWGKVGEKAEGTAEVFGDMVAAMVAINAHSVAEEQSLKNQAKIISQLVNLDKQRNAEAKKLAQTTATIGKNVAGAAVSLVKWIGIGGILSGLAGAGGLWGLDSLANTVGAGRRSAQGLGVTSAQQQAFGINFNRYIDANSNLQNVAGAQSDYSRRWAFSAMGVNPNGRDPASLAAEMAIKAKQIFDRGDQSQQSAQAHGLLEFYTMDELRRLHNVSMKELRDAEAGYGGDIKNGLTEKTQKAWQDFSVSMTRAGWKIQNVFVDALTPLVPSLGRFADDLAEAVKIFLQNPHLKQWMDDLGEGLKQAAAYLGSDKFQSDVKTFAGDFAIVCEKIVAGLKWLHIIPSGAADPSAPATAAEAKSAIQAGERARGGWLGQSLYDISPFTKKIPVSGAEIQAANTFAALGWDKNQAAGIGANLQAESGLNPFATGDHGQAYGIAQWHKDRQAEYEKLFGHTMQSVRDYNQALREQEQFVQYELTKGMRRHAGDILRAAKTAAQAGDAVSRYYESPKDTNGAAAARAANAQKVVVQVNNAAGSGLAVQASQLPQ